MGEMHLHARVPFKAEVDGGDMGIADSFFVEPIREFYAVDRIGEPPYWTETDTPRGFPEEGNKGIFEYNGWKHDQRVDELDYQEVGTYRFTKNDRVVYLINESPYFAGGGSDLTLFADKREDLEEILKDWNIQDAQIQAESVVCQTL